MKLSEFKSLLSEHASRAFQLSLPNGSKVPVSFHITEVGKVHKIFLDCGGTLREVETCQLQVWVGEDLDHRIETGKMLAILNKAQSYLPDESIPVEIEYEDPVLTQYQIQSHEVREEAIILKLVHKHTECLAPELCGIPARKVITISSPSCCGPSGCC